jgi:hypothetical protein
MATTGREGDVQPKFLAVIVREKRTIQYAVPFEI